MRDIAERVQQDTDVAAVTDLYQSTYTEDEVVVIERLYRNGRVEEVEVVNETDREIVQVSSSGEGGAIGGSGGDAVGDVGGDVAIVPPQLLVLLLLLRFMGERPHSLTLRKMVGRVMAIRS